MEKKPMTPEERRKELKRAVAQCDALTKLYLGKGSPGSLEQVKLRIRKLRELSRK